jgi:hypothetical protein
MPSAARRLVLALLLCGLSGAARAQAPDLGGDVLKRLFTSPAAKAEWFAPAFLKRVPIDQVNAVVGALKQKFGPFRSVSEGDDGYTVHLAHGDVTANLILDQKNLIASLLMAPAG